MIRDSVDVYVDGQLKVRNGQIAVQGSVVRISGDMLPMRFDQAKLFRQTTGTVAYQAVDPATGRKVDIAALSRADCGCGKK